VRPPCSIISGRRRRENRITPRISQGRGHRWGGRKLTAIELNRSEAVKNDVGRGSTIFMDKRRTPSSHTRKRETPFVRARKRYSSLRYPKQSPKGRRRRVEASGPERANWYAPSGEDLCLALEGNQGTSREGRTRPARWEKKGVVLQRREKRAHLDSPPKRELAAAVKLASAKEGEVGERRNHGVLP